jgi:hypothetical protein
MILCVNSYYFLKQLHLKHFIFVMVKCCVIFEVRTEFLNNIYFRCASTHTVTARPMTLNLDMIPRKGLDTKTDELTESQFQSDLDFKSLKQINN